MLAPSRKENCRTSPRASRAEMRRVLAAPTAGSLPRFWLFTLTIPLPDNMLRTRSVTTTRRLPEPHCALITCQPGPGMTLLENWETAGKDEKRTKARAEKRPRVSEPSLMELLVRRKRGARRPVGTESGDWPPRLISEL